MNAYTDDIMIMHAKGSSGNHRINRCGKFLVVLIAICLKTCAMTEEGWITRPGIVRKCTGDNASLDWFFKPSLGTPKGVTVSRSDLVLSIFSKLINEPAEVYSSRHEFRENAGINISNLTMWDAGKYKSTVFFSPGNSLVDETTLEIYEDCPNKVEFQAPEILIMSSIPNNLNEVNLGSSKGDRHIRVKVNVPKGKPHVNCSLFIDGKNFDCESDNVTIPPKSQKNITVAVKFEHLVLGVSNRTLIFSSDSEEPVTTTCTIESGELTSGPYIAAIVALCLVLAVLVLLLLYCRPSCRKHIPNNSTVKKKAEALREWWITDQSQQGEEQVGGKGINEETYLTGQSQLGVPVQVGDASSQTSDSQDWSQTSA